VKKFESEESEDDDDEEDEDDYEDEDENSRNSTRRAAVTISRYISKIIIIEQPKKLMCIFIFKPVLLDVCWHPVGFRKDCNNDFLTTELQSGGWVPVKTSCSFQSWQLATGWRILSVADKFMQPSHEPLCSIAET